MKLPKLNYLVIITVLLGIYYLVCGVYLNRLGYYTPESLFFIEKTRITFEGIGYKLKLVGLTSPLLPFYATFPFTSINSELAPVMASALGTAILFYLLARKIIEKVNDDFYLLLLLLLFTLHPAILYMASSGRAIYMSLIFVYVFYVNIFKYYQANTTFHISIASICLVILIFCDYKFIWLTLFFIPLVFSIAVHSLNLGEKESIFRITQSFNSPSLRRKLINKTFAVYVIMFVLPLATVFCYKLLNLTNANDLEYFHESPYATWTVLAERLNYEMLVATPDFKSPDVSLLISVKVVFICPMILLAIFLFRDSNYRILTLAAPFAFIEFLHIKYEKVSLSFEYYLIFIVLALLAVILKIPTIKNKRLFKSVLALIVVVQICTGFYYIKNSPVVEEKNFISMLLNRTVDAQQDENKDMANYINGLPDNARILADDAIAYPIIAFTYNIKSLTLPYQDSYLSAIETPWDYDNYILIATAKNRVNAYSILNPRYGPVANMGGTNKLQLVYSTQNWALYRLL